jgi:hypothetical protein
VKPKIYRIIILSVVLYGSVTWSHTEGRTLAEGVREEGAEEGI